MKKAKLKDAKVAAVGKIEESLNASSVIILTDFRGMGVGEITELRRRLYPLGGRYTVLKNTLTGFALEKAGLKSLASYLKGPSALLFGFADPVDPVRTLFSFMKQYEKPVVKGGVVEKNFVSSESLRELSTLPSRIEMLAKAVRGIAAPLSGLVNVLSGPLRQLVRVLEEIKKVR